MVFLALLVVVAAYGLAFAMHWDNRGVLWVREQFKSPAERQASVWLPDYRAVIDAKPLPGMEKDEASDLAYDPQTKTLFSVMGKNPFLVELTLQGDVLRKMPLVGWSNPEGVTVLGNGLLAIVDERSHLITIVKVDADTRELNIANFPKYDLGPSKDQNKAFEGVTWDARNQQLMLGEERPPALFTWKGDGKVLTGDKVKLASHALDMRNLWPWPSIHGPGTCWYCPPIPTCCWSWIKKGAQVSFIALLGGFNGLKNTIPRAEGVTMDEAGTLYMVSEPNLFYRFEKQR